VIPVRNIADSRIAYRLDEIVFDQIVRSTIRRARRDRNSGSIVGMRMLTCEGVDHAFMSDNLLASASSASFDQLWPRDGSSCVVVLCRVIPVSRL